jgi:prepilin-type processing-associated H-X9-DG protein
MRRRAFTIVELLVVIGILVALAAMLLPSLKKARESARSAGCASNVRQMAMGMRMYAMDNDGTMPTSSDIGLVWSSSTPGWVSYFYPSGGGTSIEFNHGAFMKYLGDVSVRKDVLRCVEADTDSANYSYVLPEQLGSPSGALMRLQKFANSSRKIIVVEMNGVTSRFDGHFNIHESGPNGDEPADHHYNTGKSGFGNHAFADGHVESLSRADVDDYKNVDRFDYMH